MTQQQRDEQQVEILRILNRIDRKMNPQKRRFRGRAVDAAVLGTILSSLLALVYFLLNKYA